MKTIIMAGGKGTRIASIASDIPKPMIRLLGKPILEYQIECLKMQGLKEITLVIGHLGHFIQEYFGDGSSFGVKIDYYVETEALGTAGALFKIQNLDSDFLLLCGDTIFDLDFGKLIAFHQQHQAWATLVSHPNSHPYDSSLLVTEIQDPAEPGQLPADTHRVSQWLTKEDDRSRHYYKNRVNAGIQVIAPKVIEDARERITKPKVDLDRDIIRPLVSSGKVFAYDTPEYIKDMGTPDRYYQTERDIQSGLVSSRNLSVRQKAVFLDRDGTLNEDVGFLREPSQLVLKPGVAEAIKAINSSGYLAIVVTNQPVIARGEVSFSQLQEINNRLESLLGEEGAYLDAIYYCPHHPDKGFAGERAEYKQACSCRKPKPGMLLQAAKDYNIDLLESFMLGDSESDMAAGSAAGCKTVMIDGSNTVLKFVKKSLHK